MPRPSWARTWTGASMRTQPRTDWPTMMPAMTWSTTPGTGSRGSRPSTTGTKTEIPAMIRTLLNDMASMRIPPDCQGNFMRAAGYDMLEAIAVCGTAADGRAALARRGDSLPSQGSVGAEDVKYEDQGVGALDPAL